MNLNVLHTILIVSATRLRVDWLRPHRILGPGIYHFEGDLRPRLRTLSSTKNVARGLLEVHFFAGDTARFLRSEVAKAKELIAEEAGKLDPSLEFTSKLHVRISFLQGLAAAGGVHLHDATQPGEIADVQTSEPVDGILEPGIPEETDTPAPAGGDQEPVVIQDADEPAEVVLPPAQPV